MRSRCQFLAHKCRAITALHKPLIDLLDLYVQGAVPDSVAQRYSMSHSPTHVNGASNS